MEAAEPAVVTVGLDGSPESLTAARWAAAEAERRHGVLRLLHAWVLLATGETDTPQIRERNQGAREVAAEGLRCVRDRHPDLPVIEDLVGEEPEPALLRAAAESQVLVLGTRALGGVAGFTMGDTSQYVVGRADGVVVLVRAGLPEEEGASTPREPRVAVGLSLHGSCDEVLGFAFAAAKARALPLHAVHGRALPGSAYAPRGSQSDVERQVYEAAEHDVVAALQPWREKYPEVPVQLSVVLASSAQVAVHCAQGADLLVVGRRNRHARFGPHLGPVAHAVVHHARCPIAVVPQR
ncbi:universal stress protein [Streptomyces sp. NPDC059740]|uniref:universal stress protein n=1 Tax=Streptomyces sp. NPDC059740 TaxID=3346926 RepID=UPI00364DD8E7